MQKPGTVAGLSAWFGGCGGLQPDPSTGHETLRFLVVGPPGRTTTPLFSALPCWSNKSRDGPTTAPVFTNPLSLPATAIDLGFNRSMQHT